MKDTAGMPLVGGVLVRVQLEDSEVVA